MILKACFTCYSSSFFFDLRVICQFKKLGRFESGPRKATKLFKKYKSLLLHLHLACQDYTFSAKNKYSL